VGRTHPCTMLRVTTASDGLAPENPRQCAAIACFRGMPTVHYGLCSIQSRQFRREITVAVRVVPRLRAVYSAVTCEALCIPIRVAGFGASLFLFGSGLGLGFWIWFTVRTCQPVDSAPNCQGES